MCGPRAQREDGHRGEAGHFGPGVSEPIPGQSACRPNSRCLRCCWEKICDGGGRERERERERERGGVCECACAAEQEEPVYTHTHTHSYRVALCQKLLHSSYPQSQPSFQNAFSLFAGIFCPHRARLFFLYCYTLAAAETLSSLLCNATVKHLHFINAAWNGVGWAPLHAPQQSSHCAQ